ncbi:hypothetical protein WA158_004196 [Blastocystis sp. Blastoise]
MDKYTLYRYIQTNSENTALGFHSCVLPDGSIVFVQGQLSSILFIIHKSDQIRKFELPFTLLVTNSRLQIGFFKVFMQLIAIQCYLQENDSEFVLSLIVTYKRNGVEIRYRLFVVTIPFHGNSDEICYEAFQPIGIATKVIKCTPTYFAHLYLPDIQHDILLIAAHEQYLLTYKVQHNEVIKYILYDLPTSSSRGILCHDLLYIQNHYRCWFMGEDDGTLLITICRDIDINIKKKTFTPKREDTLDMYTESLVVPPNSRIPLQISLPGPILCVKCIYRERTINTMNKNTHKTAKEGIEINDILTKSSSSSSSLPDTTGISSTSISTLNNNSITLQKSISDISETDILLDNHEENDIIPGELVENHENSVNDDSVEMISEKSNSFSGPSTSASSLYSNTIGQHKKDKNNDIHNEYPIIDLLFCNIYMKVVYCQNILKNTFNKMSVLPHSECIVIPTTICIDDYNRIIIGDINNHIHLYTYDDHNLKPDDPITFEYACSFEVNDVILSIDSKDINEDGIPEIIVVTKKGIYNYCLSKDYINTKLLSKECKSLMDKKKSTVEKVSNIQKIPSTIGDFHVTSMIGQGAFSNVFKCSYKENKCSSFAIKQILTTTSREKMEIEIRVLQALKNCEGISQLLGIVKDRFGVNLIFPYYPSIDFRVFIEQATLDDICCYMRSLLKSVKILHDHHIIHRDIKPKNFLYDKEKKKGILIDFGLSQLPESWENNVLAAQRWKEYNEDYNKDLEINDRKRKKQDEDVSLIEQSPSSSLSSISEEELIKEYGLETKSLCSKCYQPNCNGKVETSGTQGFRAPEVILRTIEQTPAVDIWSCGIIFLSLLTKRYPFLTTNRETNELFDLLQLSTLYEYNDILEATKEMRKEIVYFPSVPKYNLKEMIQFSFPKDTIDQCYDLLHKMTLLNPSKRITADECLQHPFLKETL